MSLTVRVLETFLDVGGESDWERSCIFEGSEKVIIGLWSCKQEALILLHLKFKFFSIRVEIHGYCPSGVILRRSYFYF